MADGCDYKKAEMTIVVGFCQCVAGHVRLCHAVLGMKMFTVWPVAPSIPWPRRWFRETSSGRLSV